MNVFDYFFRDSRSLDKDLILGRAETASYQDIFAKSLALAVKIKEEIGENNNILVLFPNSSWFLIPYLAIFKSGNVCVPLNTDIEQKNLDYIIDQCNPSIAFISKRLKPKLNLDGVTLYDVPEGRSVYITYQGIASTEGMGNATSSKGSS